MNLTSVAVRWLAIPAPTFLSPGHALPPCQVPLHRRVLPRLPALHNAWPSRGSSLSIPTSLACGPAREGDHAMAGYGQERATAVWLVAGHCGAARRQLRHRLAVGQICQPHAPRANCRPCSPRHMGRWPGATSPSPMVAMVLVWCGSEAPTLPTRPSQPPMSPRLPANAARPSALCLSPSPWFDQDM